MQETKIMESLSDLSRKQTQFNNDCRTELKSMQRQLDSLDLQGRERIGYSSETSGGAGMKALREKVFENKDAFEQFGRVSFQIPTLLEGKSTILSGGISSTEPAAGIQGAGRFGYRLRQLFRSVPTIQPTIGVLRSATETLNASPQVEGAPKSESTVTFQLVQIPIQTVAHFINFSRQALDDLNDFGEFINSTLVWALERKAEAEIISGDGTGLHLTGLLTHATAFDTTILSALGVGWNTIDVLGAAACQLRENGWNPDFAVVSPRSWFRMVSLKNSFGGYVLNTPLTSVGERVYQLTIVQSDQMAGDGFLVGDSSKAVVRQRMETTVLLSREHNSNFTSNLVTALAEERFGLEVLRPDAYVQGSLASSPA